MLKKRITALQGEIKIGVFSTQGGTCCCKTSQERVMSPLGPRTQRGGERLNKKKINQHGFKWPYLNSLVVQVNFNRSLQLISGLLGGFKRCL